MLRGYGRRARKYVDSFSAWDANKQRAAALFETAEEAYLRTYNKCMENTVTFLTNGAVTSGVFESSEDGSSGQDDGWPRGATGSGEGGSDGACTKGKERQEDMVGMASEEVKRSSLCSVFMRLRGVLAGCKRHAHSWGEAADSGKRRKDQAGGEEGWRRHEDGVSVAAWRRGGTWCRDRHGEGVT